MRFYYCIIILLSALIVCLLLHRKKDCTLERIKQKETRCGGYSRPKVLERKPYKMVSSFTTSPSRIYKTQDTLYSLREQTYDLDYILLNVPDKFARTGESYTIPDFIKKNKQVVINKLDKDYGPATKLIGAILSIPKDKDVWIVVHDDDQMYLQDTINEYKKFIDHNDNNNKFCYAMSGFAFDKDYNVVIKYENLVKLDVLEGFLSFCVHRSLFEDDFIPYMDYVLKNKEAFQSDDLIISNYIAKKQGSIYLIYNENVNKTDWWGSKCVLDYGLESDALHQMAKETENDPLGGHYKKYLRVIDWLKENKMYYMA